MSAFDTIAKGKTAAAKSKTTKVAATTTDEIKTLVDTVINHKGKIKALKAEQDAAEEAIRGHILPQQDRNAYAGNYSKSYTVEGNNGAVTYTTSDKFSVPQEKEEIEAIRKLLGKKFDSAFETRRTITLKPEAASNDALIKKIVKAIETAGMELGEVFTVTDTLTAKDGLDKDQYTLFDAKQLATFRTLVRQAKAAIK